MNTDFTKLINDGDNLIEQLEAYVQAVTSEADKFYLFETLEPSELVYLGLHGTPEQQDWFKELVEEIEKCV